MVFGGSSCSGLLLISNTQFGHQDFRRPLGIALIFTLYAITMLSIYGGKLPTIIINRTGLNPYAARMRAMLIFRILPAGSIAGTASGYYLSVVTGYHDRYWWCSSPVLVCQHFLYRK